MLLFSIFIDQDTGTIQLPITPLTTIHAAIEPHESSITMLLVLLVTALIPGTVRPTHLASALHTAMCPLATVSSAVSKLVATLTVHFVVGILALVLDAGTRAVDACTMLATHPELTFISGTVGIIFDAPARLLVLAPFTL